MTDPTHRVPRAEYEDHVCDYPPTCLCAPVVIEETWADIADSPIITELVVNHTSFTMPDYPIEPEYL